VSSLPIASTASSSNNHRKRRVTVSDDENDDHHKHGGESAVIRASFSNRRRLSGDVSLINVGNLVRSSSKVTFGSTQMVTPDKGYILTWTEGVKFYNFTFIVPGLGEIENNFALTSSPNSTLSRDKDNYVSVDACQVYGILMLWLSLATQHLIKRTVVSSLGY
jgi:hypothetical protein